MIWRYEQGGYLHEKWFCEDDQTWGDHEPPESFKIYPVYSEQIVQNNLKYWQPLEVT